MIIRFVVSGVPPKKDGANSMWSKASELQKVKNLRSAALGAFNAPLERPARISLKLDIHAQVRAGDLDNFITGVCDGLMAAHRLTPKDEARWIDMPRETWPDHPIVFGDDSSVDRIEARRLDPGPDNPHYAVEISW